MRSYPFVFLPERMQTACDRSGANGNGASSRGTRRTDNARGQLETRRFLWWTEDVAAQSERRASLLAFPSQSSVGAANRLQAFMERGEEGGTAAWYNYSAEGERLRHDQNLHQPNLDKRESQIKREIKMEKATNLRRTEEIKLHIFTTKITPIRKNRIYIIE